MCVPNAFGKCSEGNYFVLIQADTIMFSLNKMPITSHFCVRKKNDQYWIRSKHCWDLLKWWLSCEETHIGVVFFPGSSAKFCIQRTNWLCLYLSKDATSLGKFLWLLGEEGWELAIHELRLKKSRFSEEIPLKEYTSSKGAFFPPAMLYFLKNIRQDRQE